MKRDIAIPDIGDFAEVPVIEIAVSVGDIVAQDDLILMLESDKATMDIPAPMAGKVVEILVAEGDRVSAGTRVMVFETEAVQQTEPAPSVTPAPVAAQPIAGADSHAQFLVLGVQSRHLVDRIEDESIRL